MTKLLLSAVLALAAFTPAWGVELYGGDPLGTSPENM